MTDQVGWIGIGVLIAAGLAMIVEAALAAVWGLATAKRINALQEQLRAGQDLINADLKRLQEALDETRRLWQPYRRLLRWLNHPLVIALLGSFRRRMAPR